MYEIKDFKPRIYQESILHTCITHNTLVVLPTGLGKTASAMLLAIHQLNTYKNSKVLILAPTKPLCNQHLETFKTHTNVDNEEIILLTGMIKPELRAKLYNSSTIIIATPQTIKSDLANKRIELRDLSLLVIDEAHHSRENYANTFVANTYINEGINQRILGLTASPGSTKEKIEDICNNLSIDKIEIRTETDEDVKPYIQEKEIERIYVKLSPEFNDIIYLIKKSYKSRLEELRKVGLTKPIHLINKRDLLACQKRLSGEIKTGNKLAYYGISLVAQAIKIEHAQTLLETQGLNSLNDYWKKLKTETSKAAKTVINIPQMQNAMKKAEELSSQNIKHPKLKKLIGIIQTELTKNPSHKFIVFANYRFTVNEIVNSLSQVPSIKPIKLIGQKEGLNQKQQVEVIEQFASGKYNVLVGTSITEEGLDITGGAEMAIFYESVPSEIRSVQRRGRIGRIKIGKVLFLITKDTKDEAYLWSSLNKEKKMKKILYDMQNKQESQTKL